MMAKQTKVDIAPPPKEQGAGARTTKTHVPDEAETSTNLSRAPSASQVNLAFRIDPELRRELKTFAAEHDLSLKDLLAEMFAHYRESSRSAA